MEDILVQVLANLALAHAYGLFAGMYDPYDLLIVARPNTIQNTMIFFCIPQLPSCGIEVGLRIYVFGVLPFDLHDQIITALSEH
jgi:hypothetical protein